MDTFNNNRPGLLRTPAEIAKSRQTKAGQVYLRGSDMVKQAIVITLHQDSRGETGEIVYRVDQLQNTTDLVIRQVLKKTDVDAWITRGVKVIIKA